ncbi:MAG: 30S ribosomal protein S12 methylthiotransferase RimO [Verrucomicrobiota bacterium]|jgi:ribosomal protein S12 methylthiotransferase
MTANPTERPVRVGMISLGCAKNLVDAEIMLGTLLQAGLEITNDPGQADVMIVNTCSFIDSAQEESVDTILESAELRNAKNRGQALIVSGCLPQRFRDELPALLPEVDAFIGIDQVSQISEVVKKAMARRQEKTESKVRSPKSEVRSPRSKAQSSKLKVQSGRTAPSIQSPAPSTHPLFDVTLRPQYIPDYATPRFRLTPGHFAYVKIAEGCNHPCSFCIIPRMRGSHRSRPQPDVVAEAGALVAGGVKELNLISQDSTYYGLDLRANHSRAIASPQQFGAAVRSLAAGSTTICTLLRELNALPGDFWVRLLYTHPAHWTDELIRTIAECPKVARYVDIPLQHIHENMLERMRRETSRRHIVDLLGRIRAGIPGITLRTTFIVGFPGETKDYFQSLLDFIEETRFERLGVFTYSQETATRAGAMAGQVPETVKQERRERVMAAQRRIARGVSESFVGRTIPVLVEGKANPKQLQSANVSSWEHGLLRGNESQISNLEPQIHLIARGEADAPDIDGRVYVRATPGAREAALPTGEFARVKIVGCTDYDLMAEP